MCCCGVVVFVVWRLVFRSSLFVVYCLVVFSVCGLFVFACLLFVVCCSLFVGCLFVFGLLLVVFLALDCFSLVVPC